MSQYEQSGRGTCTVELNEELQQAHLELLNAHCTTHQLRIRYSVDDLARFGRRDLLRKSAQAASELNNFYSSIEKSIPRVAPLPRTAELTPAQLDRSIQWLCGYLRGEREHYAPIAGLLSRELKIRLRPYFSEQILDEIRFVELRGMRVSVPDFFSNVRTWGIEPPEIHHMDSVTFVDVVAFNEELTQRALFHALVHVVQIRALGLEGYAERWIRSYVKTRALFCVPLEMHAFAMASRFMRPMERFSVEEQVVRWIADGRY